MFSAMRSRALETERKTRETLADASSRSSSFSDQATERYVDASSVKVETWISATSLSKRIPGSKKVGINEKVFRQRLQKSL